jgi:hypothetical protein
VSAARTREAEVQRDVLRALGSLPDFIVFRNSVGQATIYNADTGIHQRITFGLCPGSADLVGMLRVEAAGGAIARWVCLEVKRPGGKPRPEQVKWAVAVLRMGAFAACVSSVGEALAAVERARRGAYE